MLNNINTLTLDLTSATGTSIITTGTFALCTLVSLVTGVFISFIFCYRQEKTKSFATTLALLPVIVQVIIMLVNGNLGTGVAVAGAFSLVRFRSMQGNAKDILGIFLSMAVGLATGTDHLLLAGIFTIIVCAATLVYNFVPVGIDDGNEKVLTITIPESLDYGDVFDDIFDKFTTKAKLEQVKTTNMGSLFKLRYNIIIKKGMSEKELLDELRVRNGNLEIICSGRMLAGNQL
ncbi:MAG: DUF4956 domain-containing protein [Ruminococcus sp.]|nr:DUF4956 domain-containing protein [Ruminococcus sp.]MBQ1433692.1 DUF4956 domain-containing protein [Ruminococcus sp.]